MTKDPRSLYAYGGESSSWSQGGGKKVEAQVWLNGGRRGAMSMYCCRVGTRATEGDAAVAWIPVGAGGSVTDG